MNMRTRSTIIRVALLGGALAAMLSIPCQALTVDQPVPGAYVREHPEEWSVKVSKKENGLIQFTIVRFLKEPRYLVAHFVVKHSGRVIAGSDSPAFGRKGENTFYFSLSPEDLAESTFDLSESGLGGTVNGVNVEIPEVGSEVYQFKLLDFVSKEILKSAPN